MSRIALDIHAHLIPVGKDLQQMPGVVWDEASESLNLDGHAIAAKSLFRPHELLAWMDENTVEHAWVSAPPPAYRQQLRGEAALQWTNYINKGLNDIAAAHPKRLTALPHVPLQDLDVAISVVEDCRGNGAKVFSLPTGTGSDLTLSHEAFTPLWEKLDGIKATLFFHPGSCADGRLNSLYLENLVGNTSESSVAIAHLILGGVLERYTEITPCFAHGGGTFPMIADRLERGYQTARPGMESVTSSPRGQLSRLIVDCICHAEAPLELAEQTFGRGNVVFGSDWPFPMGIIAPKAQLAGYDAQRLDRILRENPSKLLTKYAQEG